MSIPRSFTPLGYLSPRPALHRGASREAQWLTNRSWVPAIALSASLALVVTASTPAISRGQQDVELGYDTPEQWKEEAVPFDEPKPVELPPEHAEQAEDLLAFEMPDGTVIYLLPELPGDERRTARPDWLVDAPEPESMPPKLAERLEELSAEREAMSEAASKSPVLEIAPLVATDAADSQSDELNRVHSVVSDVSPPPVPPPGAVKKEPAEAGGTDLNAIPIE